MSDIGNAAQVRMIVDQSVAAAVETAMLRFNAAQTPPAKAEVPQPIKWLLGMMGAVGTTAIAGICFWVVTTLSELSITVARMDVRTQQSVSASDFAELRAKVGRLEQFHAGGGERSAGRGEHGS